MFTVAFCVKSPQNMTTVPLIYSSVIIPEVNNSICTVFHTQLNNLHLTPNKASDSCKELQVFFKECTRFPTLIFHIFFTVTGGKLKKGEDPMAVKGQRCGVF